MPSVCHDEKVCIDIFVSSAIAGVYDCLGDRSFRTAVPGLCRPKRHAPPVSAQGVRVGAKLDEPATDPGGQVRRARRMSISAIQAPVEPNRDDRQVVRW